MEENKFDAGKQYRWEPSDEFELTGADFNLAYNTLLEYVNTPEVRRVMRLVRTFEMMHQKFVDKVECGIIKEVTDEQIKEEVPEAKEKIQKMETEAPETSGEEG